MTDKQNEVELLPCPFCGSDSTIISNGTAKYVEVTVKCFGCAVQRTQRFKRLAAEAEQLMIAAWNRRADSELLEAAEEVVYQTCVVKCSMQSLGRCPYCDFQKLKAAVEMVKGETPNS